MSRLKWKTPAHRAGSEVVQVYVAPPGGGNFLPGGRMHPVKALKGFAKVHLGAGEKTTVRVGLNERSFSYYDVADADWPRMLARMASGYPEVRKGLHRDQDGWYVDAGTYEIQVGRSCEDIAERFEIEVEGSPVPLPATAPVG